MAGVAVAAGGLGMYAACVRWERLGERMTCLADFLGRVFEVLGVLALLAVMAVLITEIFFGEEEFEGPAHLSPNATGDSGHACGVVRPRDRGAETPSCGGRTP